MSILKLAKVPAFLAVAALTAIAPGKAEAQGGVNLVPWAGVYIPTRNSVSDLDNALSRDVSVIGGARLTSGAPVTSASKPPVATLPPRSPAKRSTRPTRTSSSPAGGFCWR
jgi:hypothetical protein